MTLILSFNSLAVTIGNRFTSPFINGNYPRRRLDPPQSKQSLAGTVIVELAAYEGIHIWPIAVRLRKLEAEKLKRIHSMWLLNRPLKYLTLQDYIDSIYEPGLTAANRTRAIADGASVAVDASGISYFSSFNVLFSNTPEFLKDGAWVKCQFQLKEGEKTTP